MHRRDENWDEETEWGPHCMWGAVILLFGRENLINN